MFFRELGMYDEKIKDLFLYGDLNPPIMSIL